MLKSAATHSLDSSKGGSVLSDKYADKFQFRLPGLSWLPEYVLYIRLIVYFKANVRSPFAYLLLSFI